MRIHLNHAGASLSSPETLAAIVGHLHAEVTLGPYEAAVAAADAAELLYAEAARLIDASPDEIAWCDSGSRAWATAIDAFGWSPGDRIIVSRLDYGGSLASLRAAAVRSGAVIEVGPCDDDGRLVLDELEGVLDGGPRAVAVTHAAAHCGTTNDVAGIGRLTRAAGVQFLVDAAQSVGQMPVSVAEIDCDALTTTGRKWLRGPRGSGFLYLRGATTAHLSPSWADASSSRFPGARRFELWERSQAVAIGLGVALAQLNVAIARDEAPFDRIQRLARRCREGLATLPEVTVWGPRDPTSAIVGFTVDGRAPGEVLARCAAADITIWVMESTAAPHNFADRGATEVCRVAAHLTNSEDDIDEFLALIAGLKPDG